jgi:hypothetical protein
MAVARCEDSSRAFAQRKYLPNSLSLRGLIAQRAQRFFGFLLEITAGAPSGLAIIESGRADLPRRLRRAAFIQERTDFGDRCIVFGALMLAECRDARSRRACGAFSGLGKFDCNRIVDCNGFVFRGRIDLCGG